MTPEHCEDCRQVSDLGKKCRACYRLWSQKLWADIPKRLAQLNEVGRELNKTPQPARKAIARTALKIRGEQALAKAQQELLKRVELVLEGPYKENMEACLQAIHSATDEKAKSRRTSSVESE